MYDKLKHDVLEFYYLYPKDKNKAIIIYENYLQNDLLFEETVRKLVLEGELKAARFTGVVKGKSASRLPEIKKEKYEGPSISEARELAYLNKKYLQDQAASENLAKLQLQDFPKNKLNRKMTFILGVTVAVIMLLPLLLPTCNKN